MIITPLVFACCAGYAAPGSVTIHRDTDKVVVENGQVKLSIDTRSGSYGLSWDGATVEGIGGEARLSDGQDYLTGSYIGHTVASSDVAKVRDAFGSGLKVTLHHVKAGAPEIRDVFWVYRGSSEVFVRLEVAGESVIGSNYLAPVVSHSPIQLTHTGDLQALFVPYDNDSYYRYSSDGWGNDSFEMSALYDAASRKGLVVGSVDHEIWKSAIRFGRDSLGLTAYAGASNKDTHDTQPHGVVTGKEIQSPRMVLGCYGDWRKGLERFGDLNALVHPKLRWSGAVPFGWSSWSGHKDKVQAKDAEAAVSFFKSDLSSFRSGNTAYLNLDSFWDNLTKAQMQAFVDHTHAAGLKAGIYWTPFVGWGKPTDRVQGDKYVYGDLTLKDSSGQPVPRLDGGLPLDPTHPGTLARIDRTLDGFMKQGFDLIKLDFMTHGALEGKHFDPKVTTGNAAYSVGMQRIIDDLSEAKVGRPVFICLSIAPLFPQGYGHSRRISCDVFANIGATEYLLNSVTYAWWINDRLYRFNDPDSACVYQPLGEPPVTMAESRSRFTASAIVDGMLLEGDDLTRTVGQDRVREIFSNKEIVDLSRRSLAFRPVSGDSGSKAGNAFVWVAPNGKTAYVAVFNYSKTESAVHELPFARLGLAEKGVWAVHDLWTKADSTASGSLKLETGPMECGFVKLVLK